MMKAEDCLYLMLCRRQLLGKTDQDFLGFIQAISQNDLVKNSTISEGIKKAQKYAINNKHCKHYVNDFCR